MYERDKHQTTRSRYFSIITNSSTYICSPRKKLSQSLNTNYPLLREPSAKHQETSNTQKYQTSLVIDNWHAYIGYFLFISGDRRWWYQFFCSALTQSDADMEWWSFLNNTITHEIVEYSYCIQSTLVILCVTSICPEYTPQRKIKSNIIWSIDPCLYTLY